jgi:hypothetical protein
MSAGRIPRSRSASGPIDGARQEGTIGGESKRITLESIGKGHDQTVKIRLK